MTDTITAVVKERTLACSPEVAFTLFTDRIGEWWPVDPHSVAGARVASITVEPLVGGFVYETDDAGARVDWALVTLYDVPHRLVLDWYPGRTPDEATRRRGHLHRDRDRLPAAAHALRLAADAADRRASYDTGWDLVLDGSPRGELPSDAVS